MGTVLVENDPRVTQVRCLPLPRLGWNAGRGGGVTYVGPPPSGTSSACSLPGHWVFFARTLVEYMKFPLFLFPFGLLLGTTVVATEFWSASGGLFQQSAAKLPNRQGKGPNLLRPPQQILFFQGLIFLFGNVYRLSMLQHYSRRYNDLTESAIF